MNSKVTKLRLSDTAYANLLQMALDTTYVRQRTPKPVVVGGTLSDGTYFQTTVDRNRRRSYKGISHFINEYLTQCTFINTCTRPFNKQKHIFANHPNGNLNCWIKVGKYEPGYLRKKRNLTLTNDAIDHLAYHAAQLEIWPMHITPNGLAAALLECIGQYQVTPTPKVVENANPRRV